MRNKWKMAIGVLCGLLPAAGQPAEVRPRIVGRSMQAGQVAVVHLAPRFATAIRMPDTVNSVVVGDPDLFAAEHSEREPQVVFIKPITERPAQTNLIISTTHGYEANLLLISRGQRDGSPSDVDFLMQYRPPNRFIIEQSTSTGFSVPQTVALPSSNADVTSSRANATGHDDRDSATPPKNRTTEPRSDLDTLLERQRRTPLPTLYGEKPGIAGPGMQILKAGISEVIDRGSEVVVLFSVVNMQEHAVELVPPQVQLGGRVKKGKIVRHSIWSNSEQLPVREFRLSARRIGPGERADGVVAFTRPNFKQSNETLLLQVADSGAIDRPALAPIGFGISTLRKEGVEYHGTR